MIVKKIPMKPIFFIVLLLLLLLLVGLSAKLALTWLQATDQLRVYKQIDFPTAATGVAWSKSGSALAVYSEAGKKISIWRTDGTKLNEMKREVNGPWYGNSISFLAGDGFVLTPPASEHTPYYTLSVWDVERGAVAKNIDGPGWAYRFAVSHDQRTAAISTDGGKTISVFSTQTWIELFRPPPENFGIALAMALSSNGELLALGTTKGQVTIYDVKAGTLVRTIDAYDQGLGMGVSALTFNQDGTKIATGADTSATNAQDNTPVRLWSVADGSLIRSVQGAALQPVRDIEWRIQGDRIAFVARDDRLRMWNLTEDTIVEKRLQPDLMAVAFSPNGRFLAVCGGDHVTIFDIGRSKK